MPHNNIDTYKLKSVTSEIDFQTGEAEPLSFNRIILGHLSSLSLVLRNVDERLQDLERAVNV